MLQGQLIHEVIENKVGQHYLGREMDIKSANAQYIKRLESYQRMAKETLTEYYNGATIEQSFFQKNFREGLEKIEMFYCVIWPQLKDLTYLQHEKFDKFKVGNIQALVKIDYISKTKNNIIVVSDWKTGSHNEEYESNLQIGTYVLWASQHFDRKPEEIRSELVYLKTGIMRAYSYTVEELEEIKKQINMDYTDMNKTYDFSYFSPSPHPEKCLSCQFALLCPDSLVNKALNAD